MAPLARAKPYRPSVARAPVDLRLDGNEGLGPPAALIDHLNPEGDELFRRYPNTAALESALAARLAVSPAQVIVTAGGDDAIERACRAVLEPGRELVLPVPTFEMFARFAHLAGAEVREVPWPEGPFPTDEILAAVSARTGAVALVSPNNPSGAVVTEDDLRRVAGGAPEALLIVDLAYVEFADEDLTPVVASMPNAVAIRTLSKAWGLAGLRVGYAVGPTAVIGWMRAAGLPYAVARPSLSLAQAWLEKGHAAVGDFISRVRHERRAMEEVLRETGARPLPSQANFVTALVDDPRRLQDALAGLGIGVRAFHDNPWLKNAVRISCPGNEEEFSRLRHALLTAHSPEALLFDMDGVLVDVSRSYREAIRATAASFGITLAAAEVSAAKRRPGSNNDWVTTQRLLAAHGVEAPLEEVTARFEAHYQGEGDLRGLWREERLLLSAERLRALCNRLPLGIVTGRPRADAERFLAENGIADLFTTLICMEDAPAKPDPAPVRLALERLGVTRAWMIGDTPDDIGAARGAGVLPLAIPAPGEADEIVPPTLLRAGAARVLTTLDELEELLP